MVMGEDQWPVKHKMIAVANRLLHLTHCLSFRVSLVLKSLFEEDQWTEKHKQNDLADRSFHMADDAIAVLYM